MNENVLQSIKENQEYHMTNVLSFRQKLTATQMQSEVQRINAFIVDGGYKKTGPTVTATFAVENISGQQVMDLEILIPLDREFVPPDGCFCKPKFHLVNALCIRHEGNPATLQNTYTLLNGHIQQYKLQPITVGYNVTIREVKTQDTMDSMVVDIYIGMSPNLL